MNISDLILSKSVITSETGVKLHLRHTPYHLEQWIEAPKNWKVKDRAEQELAGAEHLRRVISTVITAVEGVAVVMPDGQEKDFIVTLDDRGIIDELSYTVLMKYIRKDPDLLAQIASFYQEQLENDKYIKVKKKQ